MKLDGSADNFARLIHSKAPLRINDIGGWTDTWFAGSVRVDLQAFLFSGV
jgi:hypothetical protein